MTVVVHNGTDHVEQKRRAMRGNKISCRRRSMVGAKAAPLHPFRIVIKRKITFPRGIQKEKTTPIYPMHYRKQVICRLWITDGKDLNPDGKDFAVRKQMTNSD